LHKTLLRFMTVAVMVKLAVTAIGRPSGMNATATLTQLTINIGTLIQSGCSFRSQVAHTMMTIRTIVIMMVAMMATK